VKRANVMNDRFKTFCRLLRGLAVALSIVFVIAACNASKKLTKANVDEVIEGMSKKQVESILGPPTTIDTKDFVLLKKTTYLYAQGKESVTVIFKDDKVQSKASTLSE
jgi:outer membrane protein assembly factor BamE (lipoprotein component of BamABCDE complex)